MARPAMRKTKTKRYRRDVDQILHDDLSSPARIEQLKNQKFDEYKPGLGQHYCIPCAKYCESSQALKTHQRSKVHKRALRALKFGPYTKEEADAAGGRNVEKYLRKRQQQLDIHSQPQTQSELASKEVVEDMDIEAASSQEPPNTTGNPGTTVPGEQQQDISDSPAQDEIGISM